MPYGIYPRRKNTLVGKNPNSRNGFKIGHKINVGKPCKEETKKKISLANSISLIGNIPWNKNKKNVLSSQSLQKMSIAKKGKPCEFIKTKFKKGNIPWDKGIERTEIKGKNNPSWKGGKSFEPYGLEFNKYRKKEIRNRDNFICQMCDKKEENRKHSVHHIDYDKKNNSNDNLITLCLPCHSKTNENRKFNEWQLKVFMNLFNNSNHNLNLTRNIL